MRSNSPHQGSHLQPFCPPVKVYSSTSKGTFVKNAVSVQNSSHGTGVIELMLPTMITPMTGGRRTRYAVLEYDPLLDSSNIETKDWLRLAADISLNYKSFDAFVILHGTDTMSYTSSALSMLLENLGKPVIVTGAQVPLSELRNDAIENVLGALILASSNPIPEVTLFFSSTLFRGNRVSKLSNATLDAFDSPNLAPLARAGITIQVNQQLVLKPRQISPFRTHDKMSQQVVLLRLFPGLQVDTIANFFSSPIEGVVLHSFGAGNAPTKPELLEIFRKATYERGIVIVNISQCIRGEVSAIYQVGKQLQSVGVVPGADMTPECALTKLSYLLGKPELSRDQVRSLMSKSLRGELTERQTMDDDVHRAKRSISRGGGASEKEEENGVVRRFLQDILLQEGSDGINFDDDLDDLTLAAERGLLPYSIQQAVLSRDDTALRSFIDRKHVLDALPQFMVSTPGGNALSSSLPSLTAVNTSSSFAASQERHPRRQTYNRLELSLHIAAARGQEQQVRTLLEAGYSVHERDYAGRTPLYLAALNGHLDTVKLLHNAGAHLGSEEYATAAFNRSRSLSSASNVTDVEKISTLWAAAGLGDDIVL
jgi:lysophospholipase